MRHLFLIDGASGTGKSDLIEYVTAADLECGVVIKATTRRKRDYEEAPNVQLDLEFCSPAVFASLRLDYRYSYESHEYGFSRQQVTGLLARYRHVFAIVRNVNLMARLKQDYSHEKTIAVYVHSDLLKIRERLLRQHRSSEQIEFRLSRIEATFSDYVRNSAFFDEVIVNNSDKDKYHALIRNLIAKYDQAEA